MYFYIILFIWLIQSKKMCLFYPHPPLSEHGVYHGLSGNGQDHWDGGTSASTEGYVTAKTESELKKLKDLIPPDGYFSDFFFHLFISQRVQER